ncbi:SH3 domain-containing protein [Geomicrobium sediminis]|uniref:N-acetylmuramoyl-L-alanine amidase n=1 Tax=Geomicrobium sediminis TaxID=1347788 RepID=A0ABS2PDH3_9BACL|nr:N-acetylmuramoyl-L-alanine amidase [Geomicrobium sediminis]
MTIVIRNKDKFIVNQGLRKTIIKPAIAAFAMVLSVGIVDQNVQAAEEEREGIVESSGNLNVRTGPDTTYDAIGQLEEGHSVTVVNEHEDEWYEITYDEETGFVHNSYISLIDEANEEAVDDAANEKLEVIETLVVNHHSLAVRAEASGTSERLGTLHDGDEVDIYNLDHAPWVLIKYEEQFAYTHTDYLTEATQEEEEEQEETEPSQEETVETKSASNASVSAIGIVTHHNLAIRERASGSSARVGGATEGDALEIIETVNGGPWVSIRYDGNIAYTHSDYFVEIEPASADLPVVDEGTVTHRALAVRQNPSGSAERIGTLTEGTDIHIHDYVNGGPWVSFTFKGGIAYTHIDHIDVVDNTPPEPTPEPPSDGELGDVIATGIVDHHGRLAVRTTPSGSSESLGHLQNGDIVQIYEYMNGGPWVKIDYEGQVAYTHSDYMNVTQMGEVIDTATVTHHRLSVRSGPGASHDTIDRLTTGDRVEIIKFVNGGPWVEVNYNGKSGYTHLDHLNLHSGNTGLLAGRLIVVDAGHGAHDSGAQGNGLVEKTVNLEVSRELAQRLEGSGAEVIMTRTNDTFLSLSERANIANRANADLFISVHANAFNSSARGAETFYHTSANPDSVRLANVMQDRLVSDTGMSYRRVAPANFAVLRQTTMPATLVELGFLTNSGDAAIMRQPGYAARAGEALHQGFLDYYR